MTRTDEPPAPSLQAVPAAVQIMQGAEHLLFAALLVVGVAQAVVRDVHPLGVLLVGVVLVVCYLGATGLLPGSRGQILWLLLLTLGWVAAIALSSTFAWVAFALFFLYLYDFPPRVAVPSVLALAAVVIAVLLVREDANPVATVTGPLIGAAVAIVVMKIYHDLIGENEQRRRAVQALETAQADLVATHDELARLQRATGVVQERERLAREIHDTIAQGFSSILLTARAIRAEHDGDPRLARIETLAQENLEETRRVVAALTPAALDRALLAEALSRLVARFGEQTAMSVSLRSEGDPHPLPTHYEAALLRVAQSALANVREHSGAGRVAVTLSFLPDAVTLDVVDDGRGFDLTALDAEPPGLEATSGFGLLAMTRRVSELAGCLAIESAPGRGTAVAATLPLPARDAL